MSRSSEVTGAHCVTGVAGCRVCEDGSSRLSSRHLRSVALSHRSRIRYLSKKIANFNEFSEIKKKFVQIRTKIR